MCNDFGNRIAYSDYVEAFSHLRLPLVVPAPEEAPNLEPRDEIWPTEAAPVVRSAGRGIALIQRQWGLAPPRAKGRAVINLRAEGRRFTTGRCLIPASHFFEFTGERSPKTRWRFTRAGADWFCIAGLLGRGQGGDGNPVEAFAMLTVAPGPDIAPYHDRQPAILDPADWAAWLADESPPPDLLMKPLPVGTLLVRQSPRVAAGAV